MIESTSQAMISFNTSVVPTRSDCHLHLHDILTSSKSDKTYTTVRLFRQKLECEVPG